MIGALVKIYSHAWKVNGLSSPIPSPIPLNCHASGVILTIWSAISRSHAQGIESHAYQQ